MYVCIGKNKISGEGEEALRFFLFKRNFQKSTVHRTLPITQERLTISLRKQLITQERLTISLWKQLIIEERLTISLRK